MAKDAHWDLYRSFLAVLREGSLSGAARATRATQPTLGRHVEALEAALGLTLFTRSPTGLNPTVAAAALRPHAEAMEAAAAALQRVAHGASDSERGTVRITASEVMGAEVLPPLLAPIRDNHPGLAFELELSNAVGDLLRRDADIAVRMVRPQQMALLSRRIGTVAIGLFAHRRFLDRHGTPTSLDELASCHIIGFDRNDRSIRSVAELPLTLTRDLFDFRSDSDLAQLAALRAGLGIGACQEGVAVKFPDLVPVLPTLVRFQLEVWLVMHEDQRMNRPIRLVYEALAEGLTRWVAAR